MRVVILSMLLLVSGLAVGCGDASFKSTASTPTVTPITTPSGPNVLQIDVNGGPEASVAGGGIYQNVPFATAKVCSPGSTSNCVTISGLLVETGATGLRIFDNEVTSLKLPAVNASNGSPAYDCVAFGDGTYMWGSVQQADVVLAGDTASKVPIHVISSSNNGVPSTCSNGGDINLNTALALGANGILGIGFEPTDCYFGGQSTMRRFGWIHLSTLSRVLHLQRNRLQSCLCRNGESSCESCEIFWRRIITVSLLSCHP